MFDYALKMNCKIYQKQNETDKLTYGTKVQEGLKTDKQNFSRLLLL